MALNIAQIEKLASRAGVKKIAVENFLISVGANATSEYAFANLEADARVYKWNAATKNAIRAGILLHFKR